MQSVNLNEFSVDELQFIITTMEEKMESLEGKNLKLELMEESETKDELQKEYADQFEFANLWKIQAMNACRQVSVMETVKSN